MASVAARSRRALGVYGEDLAAQRLEDAGMRVLARNWSCAAGELDIVAMDRRTLVFVEVKTRRSTRFGSPVEAVDRAKVARLRRLVAAWFAEHPTGTGSRRVVKDVRLDVVAVWVGPAGAERVEHLVGVS